MIKLTLKSIWEQKGINSSSVVLLSLVFSVQLLLCAWLEGILNIYNEDMVVFKNVNVYRGSGSDPLASLQELKIRIISGDFITVTPTPTP